MAANTETRLNQVAVVNSVSSGDRILVLANAGSNTANVRMVSVGNLLGNTANLSITIGGPTTPANSTATAKAGSFFWDSDYLYVAVANNVIKRVALESF